ncbi:hypothetical protein [Salinilacihabitans rarus]|uniref:hypothetical protein n=1 Tax=Salinilacihabitans rarus TaxID=2961596 RepID=UPI0020C8735A|nr:hypothetical protein [Salinilacihabitans rarus]
MTEFSTGASLNVEVSPASLRSARQEIEDGLGDVTVDVAVSGGNDRSQIAGRERAMSRQLDTTRNEHLLSIGDAWEEALDLSRERNDLLRQLVETAELSARTDAAGSGIGGMGTTGATVVGGTLAPAAALAAVGAGAHATFGEQLGEWIRGTGAPGSDTVGDIAEVGPSTAVATGAIWAGSQVGEAADRVSGTVDVDEILEGTADLADRVTGSVSVDDVLEGTVDVVDRITGGLSASDLIDDAAGAVDPSELIGEATDISQLIDGKIDLGSRVSGIADDIAEAIDDALSIDLTQDVQIEQVNDITAPLDDIERELQGPINDLQNDLDKLRRNLST